ncbi:hypothetical protein OGAPHI_006266 [Ogataea philodendri]|uniref:GRIP domain-containing protein n=1 Tax=Ogataea philodendri TaxID=1378263 RepID=A0A9P8NYH5_9ASCO|nr:uncharacterized protein OGAPHI_006266 [Ogataea philodendri]KAH3662085.1 hypothetical protein OGAPHI_006266 [Ogataea philodendri]
MFSKISQIGKNLTDEFSRINEEVSSTRKQSPGAPNGGIDPATATKILSTQTPDPEGMTQPREMSSSEPSSDNSVVNLNVPGTNIRYSDLPAEIRGRLRKFSKYDEKYPILFEAYKAERRKTAVIGAFEKMLADVSPCTSIGEIDAVRDYLSGLQSSKKLLETELRQAEAKNKANLEEIEKLRASPSGEASSEEVEKLKAELETVKQELEASRASESKKEEEKTELATKLKEKEELVDKVQKSLAESVEAKQVVEGKVAELEKSVESNKKLTQLFKDKVSSLNEELKSHNEPEPTTCGPKKGKKKKGVKKQEVNETEVIELRHKVETLERQASEAEALQTKATELGKEVAAQKEEIENLRGMLRDVGDSLVTSKDELKSLQETHKQKISELEAVKSELEFLRIQNSDALKDHERARSSLEKKIATLEKERPADSGGEKEILIQNLKKQIEDLKAGFDKNFQTVGEENAQYQKRINSLVKEKAGLEKDLNDLSGLKEREVQLKLDLSSAQSSLARKDRLINDKESRLKYLEEEKARLNDTVVELKVQVSELKSQMSSNTEAKNAAVTKTETLRQEYNELMLRLNKVSTENNKLVKNYEEIKDRYEDLKNSKVSSSDQVDSIKRRCEELLMRNREYESRTDVLQDELSEARSMLQERTREAGTIRQLLVDTEESQNNKLKDLNARLDRVAEERDILERESTLTLKKKQRELDEMKANLEDLRDQLDGLRREKDEVEARVAEQQKSLASAKPAANGQSEASSERDYKLVESLRESLKDSETRLRDVEAMNGKLRKINEESSQKLIRLNKKYKLLSQQYRTTRERRESIASVESGQTSPIMSRAGSIVEPPAPEAVAPDTQEKMEYVKNVILGFLEHKEQRGILLPVIKTLLFLTDSDEKRLMASVP